MGPPLQSWQKKVPVFRYGEPFCNHMLCQLGSAPKAPKWTFAGAKAPPAVGGDVPYHVRPLDAPQNNFPEQPVHSMGRPRSAPTLRCGPDPGVGLTNPRMKPTTPSFGFGTTKRPSPFPGESGPAPGFDHPKRKPGPQYSMPGRRKTGPPEVTPGPNYNPTGRPQQPRHARPASAPTRSRRERPPSAGPGPTLHRPGMGLDGPKFTMLGPAKDPCGVNQVEDDARLLGRPWTYFGYNDFGHTEVYEPPERLWKTDKHGVSGPVTKSGYTLRGSFSAP